MLLGAFFWGLLDFRGLGVSGFRVCWVLEIWGLGVFGSFGLPGLQGLGFRMTLDGGMPK